LEYRGYDSAGVALLYEGAIEVARTTNRVAGLEAQLQKLNGHATGARVGIGHTRWATHGKPSERNAHPHRSLDGKIAVVHNGIFENFLSIRTELADHGHAPQTETDTECFPMLVSHLMTAGIGFEEAFRGAVSRMQGSYALACMHADQPGKILVAKSGPPLVVGLGRGEYFVASDVAPLLPHTREVVYLEDGDIGELSNGGLRISDSGGQRMERATHHVAWNDGAAELGGYSHFMQKEIFEQPEALTRTIQAYLHDEQIDLKLPFSDDLWRGIDRVSVVACGTSWHAGLVAKFLIEQIARVPVDVDYASEFRYRDPIVTRKTLALAITQSGETADTVAALKQAAARGARTLVVCNSIGSQATRLAEGTLLTHAGLEMGVASTKAFSTQLAVLTLLAIHLGRARGVASHASGAELIRALHSLPAQVEQVHRLEDKIQALAVEWYATPSALYLGRGPMYPVALEGALKLKEIAYVHAQGYPAGEMKHGPIALIDGKMPVVALVPDDVHRDRTRSNLQEAAARGAPILALVSEGDSGLSGIARNVIALPKVHPSLAPILYTVPLQLFAYHIAVLRGCDVDRPRNLAKSVTVE
jgi:glucosamine--fructose-6-phosphate aminotransferase (isomerizing)